MIKKVKIIDFTLMFILVIILISLIFMGVLVKLGTPAIVIELIKAIVYITVGGVGGIGIEKYKEEKRA